MAGTVLKLSFETVSAYAQLGSGTWTRAVTPRAVSRGSIQSPRHVNPTQTWDFVPSHTQTCLPFRVSRRAAFHETSSVREDGV